MCGIPLARRMPSTFSCVATTTEGDVDCFTSASTFKPLTCTALDDAVLVTSSPRTTMNLSAAPWTAFRPSTEVR